MNAAAWTVVLGGLVVAAALALARARRTFDTIVREEAPRMTDPAPERTGTEQFTGAFHHVVYDTARAAAGPPTSRTPWVSQVDGQFFADNEVEER